MMGGLISFKEERGEFTARIGNRPSGISHLFNRRSRRNAEGSIRSAVTRGN